MLTGKDVYEATLFATSDIAGKWDKLSTFDKHVYEVAASVLNGYHIAPLHNDIQAQRTTITALMNSIATLQQQIAPLQGLVRDYHAALVDVREGRTLMSDCAFALEKRKKVLLNEEI